jgi:predicted rRNA methylase YqxC with S4 and FtsJ domains
MLADDGFVVTLIKPHYEADPSRLIRGVLPEAEVEQVVAAVGADVAAAGFRLVRTVRSPITGAKGNVEVLAELRPG